jgi:hypothetical protein
MATRDWYNRWCAKYKLSGYRAIGSRAKHRNAAECERNVKAFFQGCKMTVPGVDGDKTFDLPGYEAAMDLPWTTEASGAVRRYRDYPARVANFDESYMSEHDNSTGCAPVGARHVGRMGGGQPQSVTVLSGATLSGHIFDDIFCWEGTCTSVNALKYAPPGSAAITRPDGYMMTGEGWLKVLEHLRTQVPGEFACPGLRPRGAAR